MYFSQDATLFNERPDMDEVGNQRLVKDDGKLVWVNVYSIGTKTWLAAKSAGLHADAEVALRTLDYEGENIIEINGREYTIERVSDTGEFTRLVLAERVGNVRQAD